MRLKISTLVCNKSARILKILLVGVAQITCLKTRIKLNLCSLEHGNLYQSYLMSLYPSLDNSYALSRMKKDLGVTLDSGLTFNNHISSLSSSLLSSLCQISRVRHLFSKEVLYIMINSVVFSKLFYCSAVWAGTDKQNIHKRQFMQNFAAHILTDTGKYDHNTPALKALGWQTIEEQLWLWDVTMMYKCVNN